MNSQSTLLGCDFNVYRNRLSKNVISLSLWKQSVKYVKSLVDSLLWWPRNLKILLPDFNIRIYIDNSIYQKLQDGQLETVDYYDLNNSQTDTDITQWEELIEQLKKHSNVEIWSYTCPFARQTHTKNHKGTFGSMVRFHPFFDETVQTCIIRNIETLTSEWDVLNIKSFMNSGKEYFSTTFPGYGCHYKGLCERYGFFKDELTLLAWFGRQGSFPLPLSIWSSFVTKLMTKEMSEYMYGIDEIFLTETFLKGKMMTLDNTYISFVRNHSIMTRYYSVFDMLKDETDLAWLIFNSVSDDICEECTPTPYKKFSDNVNTYTDNISFATYEVLQSMTLYFDSSEQKGSIYKFQQTKLLKDIEKFQNMMNKLIESGKRTPDDLIIIKRKQQIQDTLKSRQEELDLITSERGKCSFPSIEKIDNNNILVTYQHMSYTKTVVTKQSIIPIVDFSFFVLFVSFFEECPSVYSNIIKMMLEYLQPKTDNEQMLVKQTIHVAKQRYLYNLINVPRTSKSRWPVLEEKENDNNFDESIQNILLELNPDLQKRVLNRLSLFVTLSLMPPMNVVFPGIPFKTLRKTYAPFEPVLKSQTFKNQFLFK